MQIPYDLEFVENRPTVRVQAIAMRQPLSPWSGNPAARRHDVFDRLLLWAFRTLRRFEKN